MTFEAVGVAVTLEGMVGEEVTNGTLGEWVPFEIVGVAVTLEDMVGEEVTNGTVGE